MKVARQDLQRAADSEAAVHAMKQIFACVLLVDDTQ